MNTTKITKTDHFNTIITVLSDLFPEDYPNVNLQEEIAFCEHEIENLANKAQKAKESAAAKKAENDKLTEVVLNVLTDKPQLVDAIAEAVGGETTRAQVVNRLGKLARAGYAVKSEIVIPGENGAKARKLSAYALAQR